MQTQDARRATRAERFIFEQVKRAEDEYARKLRQLGRNVIRLAQEMLQDSPDDPEVFIKLSTVLERYGDAIRPWAEIVARKMVHDVALRDARIWRERAKEMSYDLQSLIMQAPIGELMRQRMEDQIGLITSIPRDVAKDVHQMAIESLWSGQRFGSIAQMIMRKTGATLGRANLIARTEVARSTTELTQVRAEFVGSPGYIWRTAHDSDVRLLHRRLEGQFIRWDAPPIAGENGEHAHAGCIYNCFPGEVLAGPVPGVTAVFRAFYSGPIVVLNVGNSKIPVTPNHPILTANGWRPACLIHEGDYVVQQIAQDFSAREQDIDRCIARLDKIFEAFSLATSDVKTLAVDNLYGDMMVGDVNVVRAAIDLSAYTPEVFAESVRKDMVSFAQRRIECTQIMSRIAEIFGPTFASIVYEASPFFEGVRGVSGEHPLTTVPLIDVILAQNQLHYRTRDAQGFRNIGGSPSLVVGIEDKRNYRLAVVSGKASQNFTGHVYTCENATTGTYTVSPERVLVQNCRCIPEVVIPGMPIVKESWAPRNSFMSF